MCLSDLARVIRHDPATYDALVDVGGRLTSVSTITLGLDEPGPAPGDWLVVHTGLAVDRLTAEEAAAILRARADLGASLNPIPDQEEP